MEVFTKFSCWMSKMEDSIERFKVDIRTEIKDVLKEMKKMNKWRKVPK